LAIAVRKRRSAKIDEIDDQQFRQAAEQSGIGLSYAARKKLSRKARPGDKAADCGSNEEAAGGDEKRHRRPLEKRQAPAALTEAEDRQIAQLGVPEERALSTQERAESLGLGRYVELEPLLGIFLD
jgi:hypothetical protein